MLSKRQMELFIKLSKEINTIIPASTFADIFHVSLRTIHQDLSCIKKELDPNYASLKAVSSKGYCLQVQDAERFQSYMSLLLNEYCQQYHFDDPLSRIHYILMRLFTAKRSLTHTILMNELYISKSALSADLKAVKQLLETYHLNLVYHSRSGLTIKGNEINKRALILKENIQHGNFAPVIKRNFETEVRLIISETLNTHRYIVSDAIFQSLIIHVELAVQRMLSENYVDESEVEKIDTSRHEYQIAHDILKRLSKKFNFNLKPSEIYYLSINLLYKKNYDEDEVISQELNDFILDELIKIREEYNLDFISDLDFRITLALHLAPMLKRLQYHMQLKNAMTLAVKQNYPLAYDIATSITKGIYERYGYKASDDETAYLALYINLSIEQDQKAAEPKRILIICPNRKSETLLLRQQFYHRFHHQIQELTIISSYHFSDLHIEDYDLIFTTEDHETNDLLHAIHIHYFLDEKDLTRIELALNGIQDVSQLKDYMPDDLMYFGYAEDKFQIIKILCEKAEKKYGLKNLYHQVLRREEIGGTYYGNQIAIPHSEQMIATDTFIALGILKRPVLWQEAEYARVILLVCIEKNNARALQLWYYLSKLISDEELVRKLSQATNCIEIKKILNELQDLH